MQLSMVQDQPSIKAMEEENKNMLEKMFIAFNALNVLLQ